MAPVLPMLSRTPHSTNSISHAVLSCGDRRQVTQMCFDRKCSTYPVANVPAAVGHGGAAMAAAPPLAAVGAAARAPAGGARAGPRAAVVPA